MKHIVLIVAFAMTVLLTACGHNAFVLDKGVGFRAGFDPEHLSADVRFVYGEALTVAARDNFEIELVSDMEGGQEQSSAAAKTGTMFRVKVGQQINGYTVDAIKAGASAKDLVRPVPEEDAPPVQAEACTPAPQDDAAQN